MSRRRDLESHRDSLDEISEIMASMKTLAYVETRKLSRFLSAEQLVVESIEAVAADFLAFHPGMLPDDARGSPVYLLIGSERGFCGDFNRTVLEEFKSLQSRSVVDDARILVIGNRLRSLLANDPDVVASIEGASVAEDVPAVLEGLVENLDSLHLDKAALDLKGICHGPDGIEVQSLLPPFAEQKQARPAHSHAPLLNVSPQEFLIDLVDHYLLAALNHMLYRSLMIENRRRLSHLEGAVRHLDKQSQDLTRRCRAMRQEEIIEEIEVILLSAASMDEQIPLDQ